MTLIILVVFLSTISVAATVASFIKWDDWWIRVFDFPRLQICFITILAMILLAPLSWDFLVSKWILFCLLGISLIYQFSKIYPYTVLAKKQVLGSNDPGDDNTISLLISNVLTTNKKSHELIQLVKENKPDVLLALETNLWWEKELDVLEKDYPHSVKYPLDNLYGMHLYSRLELRDMEVMFLVDEEIPSIHGEIILNSGKAVKTHCLHPTPPAPAENEFSTDRDAELLLVGKSVKKEKGPILVFGDLNDVAWSRTTRLFQEISGLVDPRVGRGFFNTFHAEYPIFRWPLDHVFHSIDFKVNKIKRLKNMGSDHFPMFISLQLTPEAQQEQEAPTADQEDKEWAAEKIEKADPKMNSDEVAIGG